MSWVIVELNSQVSHLKKAQYTITDRIDDNACAANSAANSAGDQFYTCKGESKVPSCLFTSKSPWCLHHQYWRIFVSIIMWHERPYYYDGMKPTKQQRFVKYSSNMVTKLTLQLVHMHITFVENYYYVMHVTLLLATSIISLSICFIVLYLLSCVCNS